MVKIVAEFKPHCVFIGSDVRLMCQVKGIEKKHVVSWIKDGREITRGEETLFRGSDDNIKHTQRILPRVGEDGLCILEIKESNELDGRTYSLRVYEQYPDNTLHQVKERDVNLVVVDYVTNGRDPSGRISIDTRRPSIYTNCWWYYYDDDDGDNDDGDNDDGDNDDDDNDGDVSHICCLNWSKCCTYH